jgi:RNase P/RNase MRP subunit POP5
MVDPNSPSTDFSTRDILNALKEKIDSLYGDFGSGNFGGNTIVKAYDSDSNIFLVRTAREAEEKVHLALTCLTSIKKANIVIRSLAVAGSSRTCIDKLTDLFHIFVDATIVDDSQKAVRRQYYQNFTTGLEL